MKAKEILEQLRLCKSLSEREQVIVDTLNNKFVPSFMSNLQTITLNNQQFGQLICLISPEYLSVGEDDDYLVIPMKPMMANKFMDDNHYMLPTPRLVNSIFKQSMVKINPPTYTPKEGDPGRNSLYSYEHTNEKIIKQKLGKNLNDICIGAKKDICLTNALATKDYQNNVCIYGWFYPNGKFIQGLNAKSHIKTYYDYSHGLRMISKDCSLNGEKKDLISVATDKDLCIFLNPTPLKFLKYT